jgi:uncharacterized protein (UPF0303 family)
MAASDDIAKIVEQEQRLLFPEFSEDIAFAIGSAIRARAVAEALRLVAEIRLWDRPLFYFALAGTTADNLDWARRKAYLVQRFGKSSYRLLLENQGERVYLPNRGLDAKDYALSGGAFPIRVKGAGVIGAITISGLPERADHNVVVDAICDHLGLDKQALALSAD